MLSEIPFISYNNLLPQYSWITKFENDVIQAMVRSSNSEKWVEWKGVRIPLPKEVDLPEGTWIQIRLSPTSKGYEMNIEILKEPLASTPSEKVSELLTQSQTDVLDKDKIIFSLVQKIISQNPELAGKIDFLIKIFDKWFDEKNSIGHLLFRVGKIIQEAVEKGIIDSTWLKIFPDNVIFSSEEKIDWQVIRNYFKEQMRNLSFEKNLFRSENIETNIQNSIMEFKEYRALQVLLKNELFVDFLKNKGYYQDFQKTLDTLYSKSTAQQIFNLNNPNYSYVVCELPVNIKDGFSRICIYSFSSRKEEQEKSKKPQHAIIAFDLELVNAGKIWIELRWIERTLECVFKIAEEKTEKVCYQILNDLENGFKSLGLKNVNIRIEDWDGDRIKNVFLLLESLEDKGWTV